jgi:hypothetical protein
MNAATRASASGSSGCGLARHARPFGTTRGASISTGCAGFERFLREPRLVTIGMLPVPGQDRHKGNDGKAYPRRRKDSQCADNDGNNSAGDGCARWYRIDRAPSLPRRCFLCSGPQSFLHVDQNPGRLRPETCGPQAAPDSQRCHGSDPSPSSTMTVTQAVHSRRSHFGGAWSRILTQTTYRNVSTTLIHPGLEFKLCLVAAVW